VPKFRNGPAVATRAGPLTHLKPPRAPAAGPLGLPLRFTTMKLIQVYGPPLSAPGGQRAPRGWSTSWRQPPGGCGRRWKEWKYDTIDFRFMEEDKERRRQCPGAARRGAAPAALPACQARRQQEGDRTKASAPFPFPCPCPYPVGHIPPARFQPCWDTSTAHASTAAGALEAGTLTASHRTTPDTERRPTPKAEFDRN
jgi:hypothetical protein